MTAAMTVWRSNNEKRARAASHYMGDPDVCTKALVTQLVRTYTTICSYSDRSHRDSPAVQMRISYEQRVAKRLMLIGRPSLDHRSLQTDSRRIGYSRVFGRIVCMLHLKRTIPSSACCGIGG